MQTEQGIVGRYCLEPLLSERWIPDIDTTVKPLYGRQEGAVGYDPTKPGRPGHCYHTYSMAGRRLVFDVDVCAGDEHASNHAAPALWALLDRATRDCWPTLLGATRDLSTRRREGLSGCLSPRSRNQTKVKEATRGASPPALHGAGPTGGGSFFACAISLN